MPLFTMSAKCERCRKREQPCTRVESKLICMKCRRIMRGLPPRKEESNG